MESIAGWTKAKSQLRISVIVVRHHSHGIFALEQVFGAAITNSHGRIIPVRHIGEQHGKEDFGFIPTLSDWVRCIRPEPWMGRPLPIERDFEPIVASN